MAGVARNLGVETQGGGSSGRAAYLHIVASCGSCGRKKERQYLVEVSTITCMKLMLLSLSRLQAIKYI